MTGFASGAIQIGVCDRCKFERPICEFVNDPNSPGLRVCPTSIKEGCEDHYDPWRLPPRQLEALVARYPRPDVDLTEPPEWDMPSVAWDASFWV